MGCVCLLGATRLLKFGIRSLTNILISCSTLIFTQYLLFIIATTKYPASQRYDIMERNVAQSEVETTVSSRCQVSLCFPWNFKMSHDTPQSFLGYLSPPFEYCGFIAWFSFFYLIVVGGLIFLIFWSLYSTPVWTSTFSFSLSNPRWFLISELIVMSERFRLTVICISI